MASLSVFKQGLSRWLLERVVPHSLHQHDSQHCRRCQREALLKKLYQKAARVR